MTNWKARIASLLFKARLFRLLEWRRSHGLIYNYHRIARGDPSATPFDPSLYGHEAESFERQVRWLARESDVLSEEDLIDVVRGKARLPARPSLITFDDGYRDNFEVAYPILKNAGLPAIFFIPADTIEQRELGWWDQIHYLLMSSPEAGISFQGEAFSLGRHARASAGRIVELFRRSEVEDVPAFLSELSRACRVALPAREIQSRELMSWEEVREMAHGGMGIGSHTCSHRILSSLSLAEQSWELSESKAILEEKIGKPVRSVAYPVGMYEHFHRETPRLAQGAGYELGFSFMTGAFGLQGGWDPLCLPRIHAPSTLEKLAWAQACPSLMNRNFSRISEPRPAHRLPSTDESSLQPNTVPGMPALLRRAPVEGQARERRSAPSTVE